MTMGRLAIALFLLSKAEATSTDVELRPFSIDVAANDVSIASARLKLECRLSPDKPGFGPPEESLKVLPLGKNRIRLESTELLNAKKWTLRSPECEALLYFSGERVSRKTKTSDEAALYPVRIPLEEKGDNTDYVVNELGERGLCFEPSNRTIRTRCSSLKH